MQHAGWAPIPAELLSLEHCSMLPELAILDSLTSQMSELASLALSRASQMCRGLVKRDFVTPDLASS